MEAFMRTLLLMMVPPLLLQPGATYSQPPGRHSDQAELVKGNNAFAADLYGQLGRQAGNLFFSPASISTALGMTYAGAAGNTAATRSHRRDQVSSKCQSPRTSPTCFSAPHCNDFLEEFGSAPERLNGLRNYPGKLKSKHDNFSIKSVGHVESPLTDRASAPKQGRE